MTFIHRHPPRACPSCGRNLNAAGTFNGDPAPPTAGDITVCFGCEKALVFEKDLNLVIATDDFLRTLPPEARRQVDQTIANLRAFKEHEGRRDLH
jgi:hypothetical protein